MILHLFLPCVIVTVSLYPLDETATLFQTVAAEAAAAATMAAILTTAHPGPFPASLTLDCSFGDLLEMVSSFPPSGLCVCATFDVSHRPAESATPLFCSSDGRTCNYDTIISRKSHSLKITMLPSFQHFLLCHRMQVSECTCHSIMFVSSY